MEFTAHNIVLPDGEQTNPGELPLSEHARTQAFMRVMRLAFGGRDPKTVRVADLACLEGGFSVELARAGYTTLGIEGREENIACCEYVRERVRLPNLEFVRDDVRNIESYGTFDALLCAGILYHLDAPSHFLEALGRSARRVVILDSHYATDPSPEGFPLGEWTSHEGRRGRWYAEFTEDEAPEGFIPRWASIGNRRSFWLDRRELVQAIRDAGFDLAFEQLDYVDNSLTNEYVVENARSMFVGVRTSDLPC